MDGKRAEELLLIAKRGGVREIVVESPGKRLVIRRVSSSQPAAGARKSSVRRGIRGSESCLGKEAAISLKTIESPMVGRFYMSSSADDNPFVRVGEKAEKGTVLGVVEAMKMLNEIEAEYPCLIREVCVADGGTVEYGTPLFRVQPLSS